MDNPKRITNEDLRKTPLLQGSIELFDINILPERYKRRKITFISALPWIILLILVGGIYPAVMNALNSQDDFREKRAELILTKTELDAIQANTESLENLQNEIISETEKRDQILDSYGGMDLQGTSWNETLLLIYKTTTPDIVLDSVVQTENEILLDGTGISYQAVLDFYDALKVLTDLQRVEITSIEQVMNEETVIPAITTDEGGTSSVIDLPTSYTFTILSTIAGEVLP